MPNRAGQYVWTVKTYGILKAHGFQCALTNVMPEAGIIITHRDFLPDHIKPSSEQLFVCVIADTCRHPFAQIHLVQNPHDALIRKPSSLWPSVFMPHWTETGLCPRNPDRGTALINIAYFGLASRLAPQLRHKNFARLMRQHGFHFMIINADKWYDYSDIDAVLAVRSFAAVPFYKHPPTKLYNTWMAGVPALLGHESAFQAERQSEYDYFEVDDIDQIIETLKRLKADPELRAAITQNCADRARLISPENTTKHWVNFCNEVAVPALSVWRANSPTQLRRFYLRRKISYVWFKFSDFLYRSLIMLRKLLVHLTEVNKRK